MIVKYNEAFVSVLLVQIKKLSTIAENSTKKVIVSLQNALKVAICGKLCRMTIIVYTDSWP